MPVYPTYYVYFEVHIIINLCLLPDSTTCKNLIPVFYFNEIKNRIVQKPFILIIVMFYLSSSSCVDRILSGFTSGLLCSLEDDPPAPPTLPPPTPKPELPPGSAVGESSGSIMGMIRLPRLRQARTTYKSFLLPESWNEDHNFDYVTKSKLYQKTPRRWAAKL